MDKMLLVLLNGVTYTISMPSYRNNCRLEFSASHCWFTVASVTEIARLILLVAEARSHDTNHGRLCPDGKMCAARLCECWRIQNDIHCLQECQTLSFIKCLFWFWPPQSVSTSYSWQDWSVMLFFVFLFYLQSLFWSLLFCVELFKSTKYIHFT